MLPSTLTNEYGNDEKGKQQAKPITSSTATTATDPITALLCTSLLTGDTASARQ